MPYRISRSAYADMFGPTVGDRMRLADTELFVEIEKDFTILGEEVKFGGGKVIRDGMGQSQLARSAGAMDTVITNAVIIDHWGIVKADVGLFGGRIAAISFKSFLVIASPKLSKSSTVSRTEPGPPVRARDLPAATSTTQTRDALRLSWSDGIETV